MKKNYLKPLFIVGCLILATCAAMAYTSRANNPEPGPAITGKTGIVRLSGQLVQDKIFSGGDGTASLSLTLSADKVYDNDKDDARHVDMVIVLDRSGSMQGNKIRDARQAVLNLLSSLSDQDRFALVSYSNGVQRNSGLVKVTDSNREHLSSIVRQISPGGGTNLGAGLHEGINVLLQAQKNGNAGKIILISDGLANEGITDIPSLGNMASIAVEKAFGISTVGVGANFNEQLMTAVADRGAGSYYYLENPNAFAQVFQKEFLSTRNVAAASVEVRVPLSNSMSLVNANGYPVEIKDNQAVFHPGDILSGQTRKLFLTFRMPADTEKTFEIKGINVRYQHKGEKYTVALSEPFSIACVKDSKEVFASIDKKEWEQKVLQEDYNELREKVAQDIKTGKQKDALDKIQRYEAEKQSANDVLKSGKVDENLNKEVKQMRDFVEHTFSGKQEEVETKQKKNAKKLQFEGYRGRRGN
ncbi:MAG: VWA domain-containing protein [Desulfobacterales bacterium]|nr:VWA domain-containing protein [Desulfobacterales bacterium]